MEIGLHQLLITVILKQATGYETAVQTWIDTYEGNNKIQYDKNGFLVMPALYKIIESKIMYKR